MADRKSAGAPQQTGFEAQLDIKVTRADGSVEDYEDVGRQSLTEEQGRSILFFPSFKAWAEKKLAEIENRSGLSPELDRKEGER